MDANIEDIRVTLVEEIQRAQEETGAPVEELLIEGAWRESAIKSGVEDMLLGRKVQWLMERDGMSIHARAGAEYGYVTTELDLDRQKEKPITEFLKAHARIKYGGGRGAQENSYVALWDRGKLDEFLKLLESLNGNSSHHFQIGNFRFSQNCEVFYFHSEKCIHGLDDNPAVRTEAFQLHKLTGIPVSVAPLEEDIRGKRKELEKREGELSDMQKALASK